MLLQWCFDSWTAISTASDQESCTSFGERLSLLRSLQLSFAAWAAAAVGDESDFAVTEASEVAECSHAKGDEWECHSTSTSLPSLGQPDSFTSEVTGDESVLGPDGDIYEVFYPEASSPDDNAAAEDTPAESCAEESIGHMLRALKNESRALTPTRLQLLSIVTSAAQKALGERLERIALVGSTALHIDTPASDIDAVAFTRGACVVMDALHDIAKAVKLEDANLEVQMVAARVPLLVVFRGKMSLDLSIDQSSSEQHVRWFQQCLEYTDVPRILSNGQDSFESIQASVLRCVKWWLWQRRLPAMKEGGYPVLAWTLMAMHSQQCSLVLQDSKHGSRNRQVIWTLAAFFDRFAGQGRQAGTIDFTESGESRFCPHNSPTKPCLWPELAVLDPISRSRSVNLIPKLSEATKLIFAREMQRAQLLSSKLLQGQGSDGAAALSELFSACPENLNSLPSRFAPGRQGAFFLRGRCLQLVVLQGVAPRPGWTAPFLHRKDEESVIWGSLCDVEKSSGCVSHRSAGLERFSPQEFVSLANIVVLVAGGHQSLVLQPEDFQRWRDFEELLSSQRKKGSKVCPPGRVL